MQLISPHFSWSVLRDSWIEFLAPKSELDSLITLATNYDGSETRRSRSPLSDNVPSRIRYVQNLVYQWEAKLHRKFLGRNWHRMTDRRMQGYGFVEHAQTNIHYHLLVDLAPLNAVRPMVDIQAHQVWRRLTGRGDLDIRPVESNRRDVVEYLLKEHWKAEVRDALLFFPPTV